MNTDDDGDDEKLGARYDMKEREKTRRDNENVTRNLHLVYFFLAAFSADFVTKETKFNKGSKDWDLSTNLCRLSSQSCRQI